MSKHLIRTLVFVALGMAFFLGIQSILVEKWYYPAPARLESPANVIEEFQQGAGSMDVQAVFLGTSHSQCSIDPMAIYAAGGPVTYNLSTPAQPLAVSYFLCAELFENQSPQVVFFDVNDLFSESFGDVWYRAALDNMAFSRGKIRLAMEYASDYPNEKQMGAFCGAFLPIYQYHSRWSELNSVDFKLRERVNYYCKGYYFSSRVAPGDTDPDWVDELADQLNQSDGWIHSFVDGVASHETDTTIPYEPALSEYGLDFLSRLKELCAEHNAELVLIKAPTKGYPQYYNNSWTKLRSNAVKEAAAEYDLHFLDLVYDVDLNIDWATDSLDAGIHLNTLGAQKVSSFFAEYLQAEYGLTGSRCDFYEEDLPIYHATHRVADLQMTRDLTAYLSKLSQWEDITIFFSVSDDMMGNLTAQNRFDLSNFGFQTDFNALSWSDAFLAVVENGNIRKEASSNRRLSCDGILDNGAYYTVTSGGWLIGSESKIIIDGVDYSANHRGLNIVVLDNNTNLVLDSVTFDTWDAPENQFAIRNNGRIETYLRDYELQLMIQDAKNGVGR